MQRLWSNIFLSTVTESHFKLLRLYYRTMYFSISQTYLLLWLPILGSLYVQCNSQSSVIRTTDALKRDTQHKRTALIKVQETDFHWFTKISIGGQVFSVLIDTGSSALWAYILTSKRVITTNMLIDGFLDRTFLAITANQLTTPRKAPQGV